MSAQVMTESTRRKAFAALLVGYGLVAMHIADAKTGPDTFFSNVTEWRGGANPLLALCGVIGVFTAIFLSFGMTGLCMPRDEARGPRALAQTIAAALCLPIGLGVLMTLQSSPPWFSMYFTAFVIPIATLLWIGTPERGAPSEQ